MITGVRLVQHGVHPRRVRSSAWCPDGLGAAAAHPEVGMVRAASRSRTHFVMLVLSTAIDTCAIADLGLDLLVVLAVHAVAEHP